MSVESSLMFFTYLHGSIWLLNLSHSRYMHVRFDVPIFSDIRWWPQERFSVKNFKKSRAKIPRGAAVLVDWYTIHKVGFNYELTIKCQFAD